MNEQSLFFLDPALLEVQVYREYISHRTPLNHASSGSGQAGETHVC